MKIGIDIDNTMNDIGEYLIKKAVEYDKNFLNGKGIINPNAYEFTKIFNWTKANKLDFLSKHAEEAIRIAPIKTGAKEVINRLKKEGHEITIITYRSSKYLNDPYLVSEEWLKDNEIAFDKLITNSGPKGIVCYENKIDLFIDDNLDHCYDTLSYNIDVLLFDNIYNKEALDLKRVSNWQEVYKYIEEISDGRTSFN